MGRFPIALVLNLLPGLLGVALARPLPLTDLERLAAGLIVGLALHLTLQFWLAMLLGAIHPPLVLMGLLAFALAGWRLLRREGWPGARGSGQRPRADASWWVAVVARERAGAWLVAGALVFTVLLYRQAVYAKGDAWFSGTEHNDGDMVPHWRYVTAFAWGHNFPPEVPIFAGVRLGYPFFADFHAATLLRFGVSVPAALWSQELLLFPAFVLLLFGLGTRVTGSVRAGLLGVGLFALSGGWGFWYFFKDLQASSQPLLSFLAHLPRDYTKMVPERIQWLTPFLTFLIPQRSFLFGFPLTTLIFCCWWEGLRREDVVASRIFVLAGVAAGLLPLLHTGSFLVVGLLGTLLACLFPRRDWLRFFAVAGVVAVPALVWLAPLDAPSPLGPLAARLGEALRWPPQVARNPIRVHVGWEAGPQNLVWFWLRNLGLFPLLAANVLLARRILPAMGRRFAVPFVACFLLVNTVSLVPWVWDNNKILVYFVLGLSAPVAAVLLDLFRCGMPFHRVMTGTVLASLVLAGGLDLFRVASGVQDYWQFDKAGTAVAEEIARQTAPRSVFLTGPYHNNPIFLSGRKSLLGFPGHAWAAGIDTAGRERDVQTMLTGGPEALELIRRYRVDYALIGDPERNGFKADAAFFDAHFPKVAQVGSYAVYGLRDRRR